MRGQRSSQGAGKLDSKPVVLAVDDKRSNLIGLEAVLGADYQLLFASSGREAIAVVRSNAHIDVILMDVQMPDIDGFETAVEIKKLEAGKDVPIIFVTAVYQEDPFVKKGYAVGGIDYFGKPFDPDILRLKVGVYASFRQRTQLLNEREKHLRESEELLRVGRQLSAVLERLSVGVMIADAEGRICHGTREAARIFGAPFSAACTSYAAMLGWWADDGTLIKDAGGPLPNALRSGERSASQPIVLKCPDGSAKTVMASACALHGLDGRRVGAVVLLQDLTEPKSIERALEERVTRLVAASLRADEALRPQ
jgi:CheY-like chemotaxis protein